jgi:hypothetical protein
MALTHDEDLDRATLAHASGFQRNRARVYPAGTSPAARLNRKFRLVDALGEAVRDWGYR